MTKRYLKATRENKRIVTFKGTLIRLSIDSSAGTLLTRKECDDIFKFLKEKEIQIKNIIPGKLVLQK